VGDNLPDRQRTRGYAMQSFFIGIGAVIAGALPWVMTNWLGLSNVAPAGEIPETVRWAFYIGGAALLSAVVWTVLTTREYSPAELAGFEAARNRALGIVHAEDRSVQRLAGQFFTGGIGWLLVGAGLAVVIGLGRGEGRPAWLGEIEIAQELYVLAALIAGFGAVQIVAGMLRSRGRDAEGFGSGFMEVVNDLFAMPATMRQLAVVQFFSWFAMFALWIYGVPAIADYHFGTSDAATRAYQDAGDWWGLMSAVRNGLAAAAALGFVVIASRIDRRRLHGLNMGVGAAGFAGMLLVRDPALLWVPQIGLGIAWASIVSLPYAILAGSVPARKMGIYMGIFNIFIVVPQLIAATLLGFMLTVFFDGAPIYAMAIGGASFALAALATLFVDDAGSIAAAPAAFAGEAA
jgi:maltose/moltooligosaccharide transporter